MAPAARGPPRRCASPPPSEALAAGQGTRRPTSSPPSRPTARPASRHWHELKEAEAKLAQKDQAGALAALEELAHRPRAMPRYCAISATLLAAERQLDKADPAELTSTLEPLAAGDAPWRQSGPRTAGPGRDPGRRAGQGAQPAGRAQPEVGVPPSQQRRAAELLQAIGGRRAAGQLMTSAAAPHAAGHRCAGGASPAAARALGSARPRRRRCPASASRCC